MTLKAIKWEKNRLEVLDQLLLPHESNYIHIENAERGWEVINKMQVRGAPAIAIVGCLSIAAELALIDLKKFESKEKLNRYILQKVEFLITARPTAVNLKITGTELINYSQNLLDMKEISLLDYNQKIIEWCTGLLEEDIKKNKLLSEFGCQSLKSISSNKLIILTHCNTGSLATAGYGTALGVIRKLHEYKRIECVYCTETRPYNQGSRLTAYELVYENIPTVLICDNMTAALMKTKRCDAVIVGADRIARNGDTANKIGTYQLAILAKHHKIPFYVCASFASIDFSLKDGASIPIEERPAHEITTVGGKRIAASDIQCWNPAFDVTPAEYVTGGIVTEKGVLQPHSLCDAFAHAQEIHG